MRRLLLAGVAALAAGAACAEPVPTWTGFYLGVEGGYGLGSLDVSVPDFLDWDGVGMRGWNAGGFAGYGVEFGGNFVGGIEIGGDWSNLATRISLDESGSPDYSLSGWFRTDWTASASARLGYLINRDTLFFASLGGTLGRGTYGYSYEEGGNTLEGDSVSDTYYGVAFAAIGAETYLTSHLRFRYQYVLNFLDTREITEGLELTPLQGIAKAAFIYDFGGPPGEGAEPAVNAPSSWTGLYVGASAGHSMGSSAIDFDSAFGDSFYWDAFGASGLNGGAFAGANLQIGSCVVLGLEASANVSNFDWELSFSPYDAALRYTTTSWYEARGRLGFLATPGTMIYGFAGLARVNSKLDMIQSGDVIDSETFTRDAMEYGGGVEAWLSKSLSLRGEYLVRIPTDFTILEDEDYVAKLKTVQSTASISAIYHFGK